MATNINAGPKEEIKRSDIHWVFPEHIKVDFNQNGRFVPVPNEQIQALAESIMTHGQLEPCEARKLPDKSLQLTYGYTRYKAVQLINNKLDPSNPRRLAVKVIDGNEKQAFIRNIVENADRNSTNLLDDAHNQNRLRNQYQLTDSEIAKIYHKTTPWIIKLKSMLSLDDEIQKSIIDGTISPSVALNELAQLTEDEQKTVLEKVRPQKRPITSQNEKPSPAKPIKAKEIREAARTVKEIKGESAGKRTIADLRKFHSQQAEVESAPESVREFHNKCLQFLEGKITDKQMTNAIAKLSGD